MNYNAIVVKMFQKNYKRYLLYFLCNAFSIMLFYSYAAIFTNESFMHGSAVDSSISSNIIAPSALVTAFLILFVPYSHSAFHKLRRNDYGILLTLGMTEREVFISMLIENGLIAFFSIIFGLLIGTVISILFYWIIKNMIGINGLTFQFKIKSYEITVALYGFIFGITVLVSVFQSMKMEIVDFIKERYKADKGKQTHLSVFYMGIFMILGAIILMFCSYDYWHTEVWFYSMALFYVGSYFGICNSEVIIIWIEKHFTKKYRKNCLFYTDIKYHFHSIKKILIVMVWLFEFSIFFMGFCMITYPNFTQNAVTDTPYQMEFSNFYGMNNISETDLQKIFDDANVKVTEEKSLEFLRNGAFNLLSATQVNKVFNRDYNVEKGKFLQLFQYNLKDGYDYDLSVADNINFIVDNKTLSLNSAGYNVEILFSKNHTLADRTLILNENDYAKIKRSRSDYHVGILRMFNFDNWSKSGILIDNLQQKLNSINHIDKSRQRYYLVSSRVEEYKIAKQSAEFLIFLVSFVLILFLISSNLILHFKIQLDIESEQRKYKSLYWLGMSFEEMKEIILYKNSFLFLTPVLIGSLIGSFYNFSTSFIYGYGWVGLGYCVLISFVVILIQWFVLKKYTKYELSNLSKLLYFSFE